MKDIQKIKAHPDIISTKGEMEVVLSRSSRVSVDFSKN